MANAPYARSSAPHLQALPQAFPMAFPPSWDGWAMKRCSSAYNVGRIRRLYATEMRNSPSALFVASSAGTAASGGFLLGGLVTCSAGTATSSGFLFGGFVTCSASTAASGASLGLKFHKALCALRKIHVYTFHCDLQILGE